MNKTKLHWWEIHEGAVHYWQTDYGFWIAPRRYNTRERFDAGQPGTDRYVLYNGDNELGDYETLDAAMTEAEPHFELVQNGTLETL